MKNEINQILKTISLLNSMVNSGELHSNESYRMVKEAQNNLDKIHNKLQAREKPSNCILGDVSNRYDRSDMEYAYNADRGWQTFDKFIEEYDAPI